MVAFILLALLAAPSDGGSADGFAVVQKSPLLVALEARPVLKLTLETRKATFAAVVSDLRRDHPEFQIKVLDDDFRREGITQNARVREFTSEGQTVAEILTALAMKMNNTVVKAPSDPDQQVVWVIGSDPENKRPGILITTRRAATAHGDILPDAFQRR